MGLYLFHNGPQRGPSLDDDIRRMLQQGAVRPADMVWEDEMEVWDICRNRVSTGPSAGNEVASPVNSQPPAFCFPCRDARPGADASLIKSVGCSSSATQTLRTTQSVGWALPSSMCVTVERAIPAFRARAACDRPEATRLSRSSSTILLSVWSGFGKGFNTRTIYIPLTETVRV